jgi:hypothetical protein
VKNSVKAVTFLLVTIAVIVITVVAALGVHSTAKSYADGAKVIPYGELPFLESDNYKWSNWVDQKGVVDQSEAHVSDKPVHIQWASPNKYFLQSVVSLTQLFWGTEPWVKNHALFFAMPFLSILMGTFFAWYFLYRLDDWLGAIFLPLLLSTLPAVQTQLYAGRPDHHGPIIFLTAWFLISLTSTRRTSWGSALPAALALWVSPLSFVPIIGMVGIGVMSQLLPQQEISASRLGSSQFWKYWSYWIFLLGYFFWLIDFSWRPGFHMETLTPLWVLSVTAGGLLLSKALAKSRTWYQYVILLVLILASPAACLFPDVFWTSSDPVVWFHKEVFEMLPGKLPEYFMLLPLGFIALTVAAAYFPSSRPLAIAAALISVLYLWQVRWLPLAVLPALIIICRTPRLANHLSDSAQLGARALVIALLCLQTLWAYSSTLREGLDAWDHVRQTPETYRIAAFGAIVAKALENQPEGHLLGSPNMTSVVHHFSRRKGVGSVYWESRYNMERAAKIVTSLPFEDRASFEWLRKNNIRYIILTPQLLSGPYYGLMGKTRQAGATLEGRVITGNIPGWLEEIVKIPQPWPGIMLLKVKDKYEP